MLCERVALGHSEINIVQDQPASWAILFATCINQSFNTHTISEVRECCKLSLNRTKLAGDVKGFEYENGYLMQGNSASNSYYMGCV